MSAVLLGASRTEQLAENIRAVQVRASAHVRTHAGSSQRLRTDAFKAKTAEQQPQLLRGTNPLLLLQVLPKLSPSVLSEVEQLLGNKPYRKKDLRP